MIGSIFEWLTGTTPTSAAGSPEPLQLALTALLVEAAHSDHHFDEAERGKIAELVERRFTLSQGEARALLSAGEREASRSVELFHLTRVINERLSADQRIELVEMLWEVAYADGVLDKFEDSLLRRVAGLIYVSDRERGLARRRVLQHLGVEPDG